MRVLLAPLILAVLAGCGGGDEPRARVEKYVRSANTVEQRFAPEFKRANDAYSAYSRGELRPRRAQTDLGRAAEAMEDARADMAALRPPAEARKLHDMLLRYLGMNLAFARETARLATYLPGADRALAPLEHANRELSRRLAGEAAPDRQAAALQSFTRALERMLRKLRALDVPAVLAPTHRDQLRRLASTRSLAERLRRALLEQDAREVARLLERFRENGEKRGARTRLAAKGIRRYNHRYQALTEAHQDVQRELGRLDRTLPQG